MAINFLDGILVNSGTGSASTIVAAGARPITLTGGAIGSVAIGGSNGGWATGYFFTGYSGTNRGGFGALGNVDALSYYYIGDAYNDTTMIVQPNAGSVGIGTTAPSDGDLTIGTPKLHVAVGGTSGTFNLAARFQSTTSDANNTGTSILINSSNDRGLLIKAGRKDGDREVAYFDVVSSAGNTTNMLTMGKFDSAFNVGIGTTAPGAKLHVRDTSGSTSTVKMSAASNNANYAYLKMTDNTANTAKLTLGTTYGYSTDKDTITLFNGNAGIGTTSPSAKLQVNAASGTTQAIIGYGTQNLYVGVNGTNVDLKSSGSSVGTFSFSTGNAERLRITSAGYVGIGTTSPSAKLHVSSGVLRVEGAGCGIQMPDTSGNPTLKLVTDQNNFTGCNIVNGWGNSSNTGVGIGTTRSDGIAMQVRTGVGLSSGFATNSGTTRFIVYGNGQTKITNSLGVGANASGTTGRIDASNDVVAFSTSDIRLKDNIKSIDKALDKVNSIQGIEFDWIEKEEVHGNSGHDIGVIAQEVEKILPDVVTTRDNGYKAVKYEKIVPLLIEAIKDLSKQVDGLKRLI